MRLPLLLRIIGALCGATNGAMVGVLGEGTGGLFALLRLLVSTSVSF